MRTLCSYIWTLPTTGSLSRWVQYGCKGSGRSEGLLGKPMVTHQLHHVSVRQCFLLDSLSGFSGNYYILKLFIITLDMQHCEEIEI